MSIWNIKPVFCVGPCDNKKDNFSDRECKNEVILKKNIQLLPRKRSKLLEANI